MTKATRQLNGTVSYLVAPGAIRSEADQFVSPRDDCGKQFSAQHVDNIFQLGKIVPGCNFSIINLTSDIKAAIRILPHAEDEICFAGTHFKGGALYSPATICNRGDYVKLASLDGKMWHVVESSGTWIKEGLAVFPKKSGIL